MTREIPLSRGLVALVDDADYEMLIGLGSWHAKPGGKTLYARLNRGRKLYMHKVLTGWPITDHINRNGLDNRRANLRPATASQNQANRVAPVSNCGYKGVNLEPSGKWRARLVVRGQVINLGCTFDTALDAAQAYDAAAIEHFGEFARPNLPTPRPMAGAS